MKYKDGGNMKESERVAEFNALMCEVQSILIEADALRVRNREYELQNQYPLYTEADFMKLANEVKAIAEKFRKLGGVKEEEK